MDIWGLTVAAFRRWYVLIPLLLVSLALAYVYGSRAQTEYEVNGAVMLIAPPQEVGTANPYADDAAVEILVIKATSSSTRAAFAEQGLSQEYEIDYAARSPVMTMRVVAASETSALETGSEIIDYLKATLDQSQEELGIREPFRVTLAVVDAPDTVEPVVSGRLRVTGIIGILGIVLSVFCAVVVDVLLTRRKRGANEPSPVNGQSDGQSDTDSADLDATRLRRLQP